ncbi:hypothetical protein RB653_000827 [Dictyostelium firmibasis]|uniref:Transmembrane protein n=1 Tax=Dictyostelium firmibasis TaxID=79012 RepID=A0AAN7UFU6_9MYCE
MGSDYIPLSEENSSFHNENLNNNNINYNNVNTTYTPQLAKLDTHYDGGQTYPQQTFTAPTYIQPIHQQQQQLPQQTFTAPMYIQQQHPQYLQPIPNVIVKTVPVEDESHFNSSLIVFILGFFISCLWLINIRYLKSKNKNAKTLATVSLVMFVVYIVFVFILIVATSASGSYSNTRYNYN